MVGSASNDDDLCASGVAMNAHNFSKSEIENNSISENYTQKKQAKESARLLRTVRQS